MFKKTIGILIFLLLPMAIDAASPFKKQKIETPAGSIAHATTVQKESDCRHAEVEQLMKKLGKIMWHYHRKPIIARLIKQHNIDPNAISIGNQNPLADAVRYDDIFFASFLLNHKADPNQVCYNGEPIASQVNSLVMAQLLFGHKAQITDTKKHCTLRSLIHNNVAPALIPLYIEHGASANTHPKYDYATPLVLAITARHRVKYVSELLKAGAVMGAISSYFGQRTTAPGRLKTELGERIGLEKKKELQEIRSLMKQAYEQGEYQIQLKAIEQHLIPDLAKMCMESYEQLEKVADLPSREEDFYY